MKKEDLVFISYRIKHGSYGEKYIKAKFPKYDWFMHKMKYHSIHTQMSSFPSMTISPVVGSKWSLRTKYLMVLDTDTPASHSEAIEELDRLGIRHFTIESSTGHYWIICDYISTRKKIVYQMEEIPGVDCEYIKHCRSNEIELRAFPKGSSPKFDDTSSFTGKNQFEKWVLAFKEYWESEDMDFIEKQIFLRYV